MFLNNQILNTVFKNLSSNSLNYHLLKPGHSLHNKTCRCVQHTVFTLSLFPNSEIFSTF